MDFALLPVDNLISVFNKVKCTSFCRLQQTCKWMDLFVRKYRKYSHHPLARLRINLSWSPETYGFFSVVLGKKKKSADVSTIAEYRFKHIEFIAGNSEDPTVNQCTEQQRTFLAAFFKSTGWVRLRVELKVNVCLELLEEMKPILVDAHFYTMTMPTSVNTYAVQMDAFKEDWYPLNFVEKCILKTNNIKTMVNAFLVVFEGWRSGLNRRLVRFETGYWCHSGKQSREEIMSNISEKMFPWLEEVVLSNADSGFTRQIIGNNDVTAINTEWRFLIRREDGASATISFLINEQKEDKPPGCNRCLLHRLIFSNTNV